MAFEVNRDVIRAAAKQAGITGASYRSKDDNIALLQDIGVIDVTAEGSPVYSTDGFSLLAEQVGEQARSSIEREVPPQVEPDPVPDITYSTSVDLKGNSQVTFVVDGELSVVRDSHANYARIVTALLSGQDPTEWLDESGAGLLEQVVSILGPDSAIVTDTHGEHHLYIDGVEVDGKLVEKFIGFWADNKPFDGLLKFLERVACNPLSVAEVGLYNWDSALTIDNDGYFIGFKSVIPTEGGYEPHYGGAGFVNGVACQPIIQNVGDVVTMDRDDIEPGPECGVGLHVGTWGYASTYSHRGVVMEVRVDPADIINVPHHTTGKLRCCRYEIISIHDNDGNLEHHEPEAVVAELPDDPEVRSFFKRLFSRKGK